MTTLEIITAIIAAITDIVIAGSFLVTASVAVYGVKNWSRKLWGKASFEVARGLMRATYKFRDELGYCRAPLVPPDEFPKDYPLIPKDSTPEKEAEARDYIFKNRWRHVAEAELEFEKQAFESEVLWGSDIKSKTNELRRCARQLFVSMEAMVANEASDNKNFKSNSKFAKKIEDDVWDTKEETNKLSQRISNAVAAIEAPVRPHIKRN